MSDGTPVEQQWYSTSFLIVMLQQPPSFVEELARRAGVQPGMHVNGVPHYRGDAVQRMGAVLRDARMEAEAAANN